MSTNAQSCEVLTQKKCQPCEGGVPKMTAEEVAEQMKEHPGWEVTHQGERIARNWTVKNFMAGMEFFHQVAEIAESEGHHPDLQIVGYRHVTIEIWTHAIGGLSENDFILAAKIDQLPIQLQS